MFRLGEEAGSFGMPSALAGCAASAWNITFSLASAPWGTL